MFETAVYRPPLATRWRRLGAAALDLLLILPCFGLLLVGVILDLSAHFDHVYGAGPSSAVPEATVDLVGVGVALITGVLLLQARMMYLSGQTVGKKLLKIRVVKVNGRRCGLGNVLLRGTIWHFVGFLLAPGGFVLSMLGAVLIFGADRRCLHDLVAGTVVVQAE